MVMVDRIVLGEPDPRVAELFKTTDAVLFDLKVVEGIVVENQEVWLDGRSFVRCTFRNCTIHLRLGLFSVDVATRFEGDTSYTFAGPAEVFRSVLPAILRLPPRPV